MENVSSVLEFTLSGLDETMGNRYMLFFWTAFCYYLILLCNISVIFSITQEKTLHEPMYVFLCNLCINSVYGTTGFYPKFMYDLLESSHVISYAGCLIQTFVIYSAVLGDFSTLTVMAYDRYVAICRPLEYHSEMTNHKVIKCIFFCWLAPFFCMTLIVSLLSRLTLCGSKIDKLYCETWAVAKLSCYSTTVNNVVGQTVISIYFGHAVLIFCSYIKLIQTCRRSREGRHRFMQTCTPHLLALFNITITLLFDVFYSRYGSSSLPQSLRNFLALEFLFIPPILNPLIYGLQLTKIRRQVMRLCFRNNVGQA